mgnify:CR=1 FL=1
MHARRGGHVVVSEECATSVETCIERGVRLLGLR